MNTNTNAKTYTADEFKAICRDMVPFMNAMLAAARKHHMDGGIRVYINPDGYISMEGGALNGWELARYKDDEEYTARFSYSERFTLDGDTGKEAQG